MAVDIALLGPPRVVRDGASVAFETRKAMALLAHLAMTGRARPREALCELLYPGQAPERARGALRRTLSTLRKGIGAEWIETAGNDIALKRGPSLTLDVERFRALGSDDATLSAAAALFAGTFLEGFSLRDSSEFDDWQAETTATLASELCTVLERLVAQLAARRDFARAIPNARRMLALDPLRESAHCELIRLHAWNGDRSAAIEQYRACVRTLSQELGVAPLEQTAALYAAVNDGTLAPPTEPRTAPRATHGPRAAVAPAALPLVGREGQLTALLGAHADAERDGGLAVIEGEAGVGKTRLATELVEQARAGGAAVVVARCHIDEAGIPYGPVVELLREATRDATRRDWPSRVAPQCLADAGLLLPELADLAPDTAQPLALDGPAAQVRLLEGVTAVLSAACAGSPPGLVLLDDAHAADEATIDTIAYLGRRLSGRPLLLVVTWRSEAVPPGHRLRSLAADLSRTGRAAIVRPDRLDGDAVAELVRSAAPGRATPELERRVHLESEGLPLFVAEYLAALDMEAGHPGTALSRQTRGLLDARLAGLGAAPRQVLGAAAAIGRSFDVETVRRASGRSEEETADALEQLVARGVVREGAGDEPIYDFSHDKLRALVYEQTALARRRLLHGRIAAALSARPVDGAPAALVAQHLHLAGDDAAAGEQHLLAADHASALFAHAEALEHLEAALALGHPGVAILHERIADLRTLLGDYSGALAAYEAAAAYCDGAALAPIEQKLGNVHHRRGEWDHAERHLLAALDAAADQRGLRARIQADLGLTLHQAGEPQRATELARETLTLATAEADLQAQAQVHNMLGVLARSDGRPERAIEELECSLRLANALHDATAQAAALNNLALVRRDGGELQAALDLTERALELCKRAGDRHREAALENNLADLHHVTGNDDEAMVHLRRAVTIFREVGADEATRLPEIWKLVSW